MNDPIDASGASPVNDPPPRRTFGTAALVAVAIVSAATAGGGAYLFAHRHGGAGTTGGVAAAKEQWQCPMHPTIVQDHPGDCPICGMKLVKMNQSGEGQQKGGQAKSGGPRKLLYYRSPMDPKQTSPAPRKDEMGMDYVPVYEDEAEGGPTVEGLATVKIDPDRQQLIGLRTTEATRGRVGGAWRTVGRVGVDETRVRQVNLKVPGYIERIYVNFLGQHVKRGEPLFAIYSPELVSAQEEYLLALRTRKALSTGTISGDGEALAVAARRRLELWDIPESEITRLEKTGRPTKTLTLYSPIDGVVTRKDVVQGTRLDAGAMPYEIVDLSEVWVQADIYESELRHVKLGMSATLVLGAYPNREFKGRVSFVDPILNPKTRTVRVRLAFSNRTGELKPDMYGDVVLRGQAREGVRVPFDAIIDSGTEEMVFVALGDGKFQPRAVQIGDRDGQNVEVVSGVAAGEQVVTRANFLVDSESRLRASLAMLTEKQKEKAAGEKPGGGSPVREKADAHAGHGGR